MDEGGCDLNMLNESHQGGTKYERNVTRKYKKFTMLGLTNLAGEPIMYIVIFEEKERNAMMESGIDPFCPLYDEYIHSINSTSSYKDFVSNYREGSISI